MDGWMDGWNERTNELDIGLALWTYPAPIALRNLSSLVAFEYDNTTFCCFRLLLRNGAEDGGGSHALSYTETEKEKKSVCVCVCVRRAIEETLKRKE